MAEDFSGASIAVEDAPDFSTQSVAIEEPQPESPPRLSDSAPVQPGAPSEGLSWSDQQILDNAVNRLLLKERIQRVESPVSSGLQESAIQGVQAVSSPKGLAWAGALAAAPEVAAPALFAKTLLDVPDAVREVQRARETGDRADYYRAIGNLAQTAGVLYGTGRSSLRTGAELKELILPEAFKQLMETPPLLPYLPAKVQPGERGGIPIPTAGEPVGPRAPKQPPIVPETAAEARETVIEAIRKADARTLSQIQSLFPEARLTREQARVFRNIAFPPMVEPVRPQATVADILGKEPPPEEPPAPGGVAVPKQPIAPAGGPSYALPVEVSATIPLRETPEVSGAVGEGIRGAEEPAGTQEPTGNVPSAETAPRPTVPLDAVGNPPEFYSLPRLRALERSADPRIAAAKKYYGAKTVPDLARLAKARFEEMAKAGTNIIEPEPYQPPTEGPVRTPEEQLDRNFRDILGEFNSASGSLSALATFQKRIDRALREEQITAEQHRYLTDRLSERLKSVPGQQPPKPLENLQQPQISAEPPLSPEEQAAAQRQLEEEVPAAQPIEPPFYAVHTQRQFLGLYKRRSDAVRASTQHGGNAQVSEVRTGADMPGEFSGTEIPHQIDRWVEAGWSGARPSQTVSRGGVIGRDIAEPAAQPITPGTAVTEGLTPEERFELNDLRAIREGRGGKLGRLNTERIAELEAKERGAPPAEAPAPTPRPEPAKPSTVRDIALEELRARGWNTDWPFIPADLASKTFRDAIASDPTLSAAEKAKILSFGPGGSREIKLTAADIPEPAKPSPAPTAPAVAQARAQAEPEALPPIERKSPSIGTAERTAIESAFDAASAKRDAAYEKIAKAKEERDKLGRFTQARERKEKQLDKLEETYAKVKRETEENINRGIQAHREDRAGAVNPLAAIDAREQLGLINSTDAYNLKKRLAKEEAIRQGATPQEADAIAIDAVTFTAFKPEEPLSKLIEWRTSRTRFEAFKRQAERDMNAALEEAGLRLGRRTPSVAEARLGRAMESANDRPAVERVLQEARDVAATAKAETKAKEAATAKQEKETAERELATARRLAAEGKLYWIRAASAGKERWIPVEAKPMPISGFPWLKTFIRKSESGNWIVTEQTTGLSMGEAKVRADAIKQATDRATQFGEAALRQRIETTSRGLPPKPSLEEPPPTTPPPETPAVHPPGPPKAAAGAPEPPPPKEPPTRYGMMAPGAEMILGDLPGLGVVSPATEPFTGKARLFSESVTDAAKWVRDIWRGFAMKQAPRITDSNRAAGEAGVQYASSHLVARSLGLEFAGEVRGQTKIDKSKLGTALTEDNLRSVRAGWQAEADKLGAAGDTAGAADAQAKSDAVRTLIGAERSPFKTEAEYKAFLNDPVTQEVIARHKQLWADRKDPIYRKANDLNPDVPLSTRGLETGARINLKAIAPGEPAVKPVGGQPAKLRQFATKLRRDPFAQRAKGTGEAYETDYDELMAHGFGVEYPIASQHGFIKALLDAGDAVVTAKEINPDLRIKGERTVANLLNIKPWRTQWLQVRRSLADEYRAISNLDEKWQIPLLTPLNNIMTKWSIQGLAEGSTHASNLMTEIFTGLGPTSNPLINAVIKSLGRPDLVYRIPKVLIKAFTGTNSEMLRLAEQGMAKQPYQGRVIGNVLNAVDKGVRLVSAELHDGMAKEGWVEDTVTDKREFINQVGNYNKRLQPFLIRKLRDTGIQPFATAMQTFNVMGLRRVVMAPGAKATSNMAALALRADIAAGFIGFAVLATMLNKLVSGSATGPKGTPLGSIGWTDERGRVHTFNLARLLGYERGPRFLGLTPYIEARRNGLTHEQGLEAMQRQWKMNALSYPAGPGPRFLYTAGTGMRMTDPETREAPAVPPTESLNWFKSQMAKNIHTAFIEANPLVSSIYERQQGKSLADIAERQLSRYTPRTARTEQFMEALPRIVTRRDVIEYADDVAKEARKLPRSDRIDYINKRFDKDSLEGRYRKGVMDEIKRKGVFRYE